MNAPQSGRAPLGQTLVATGIITEDQLRIALLEQSHDKRPIGQLLIDLGFVSEAALRDALSESLGKQSVDLANTIADAEALALVPQDLAKRHHLLPLSFDSDANRLTVAIADINDVVALDKLRGLLAEDIIIETLLAGDAEIARSIDQYYGHKLSIDGILHEIETGEVDFRSITSALDEYSQPVVRLIDALLTNAVKRDASDIHFEPEAAFLRIRYRIDAAPGACAAQIILGGDGSAHQGDRRAQHRRDPRPAGRPHLAERERPPGGLSRLGTADHPR